VATCFADIDFIRFLNHVPLRRQSVGPSFRRQCSSLHIPFFFFAFTLSISIDNSSSSLHHLLLNTFSPYPPPSFWHDMACPTSRAISRLGIGSYRLALGVPEHEKILYQALERQSNPQLNINLIDTSSNYSNGRSEQLIGKVLSYSFGIGGVRKVCWRGIKKANPCHVLWCY